MMRKGLDHDKALALPHSTAESLGHDVIPRYRWVGWDGRYYTCAHLWLSLPLLYSDCTQVLHGKVHV